MKKYCLFIPLIVLFTAISGCATPVTISASDVDTPEKALRFAIAEYKGVLATAESLREQGIIARGTRQHANIKRILQDGVSALEDAEQAIRVGNTIDFENKEAALLQILILLRKEIPTRG